MICVKDTKKKQVVIEYLKEVLALQPDYMVCDHSGLSVADLTQLRKELGKEARYKILKNTLLTRVFKELEYPFSQEFFRGPTALLLAQERSNQAAKVLVNFLKNKRAGGKGAIALKGGVIGGKIYSTQEIQVYSQLPSFEVLLQQLMGTVQSPMQGVVGVLQGVAGKLVRTLQAVKEKKEQ